MSVEPIPAGYHSVTPYLVVRGVARLIEFVKQAFGAELSHDPLTRPDGTIMHAEVRIGDSRIMLGEPAGEFTPMPANLHLYVERVDDIYARALQAGATPVMAPADQFYGDRHGGVKDAAGNVWWIATHIEDVAPAELARRAAAANK